MHTPTKDPLALIGPRFVTNFAFVEVTITPKSWLKKQFYALLFKKHALHKTLDAKLQCAQLRGKLMYALHVDALGLVLPINPNLPHSLIEPYVYESPTYSLTIAAAELRRLSLQLIDNPSEADLQLVP